MSGQKFSAHETLTVSSSSVGFTTATYSNRSVAKVTVEGASVRFWPDGAVTPPTATVGHLLAIDDVLTLDSEWQLDNIRFIRTGSVDAALQCSFGS